MLPVTRAKKAFTRSRGSVIDRSNTMVVVAGGSSTRRWGYRESTAASEVNWRLRWACLGTIETKGRLGQEVMGAGSGSRARIDLLYSKISS